MHLLTITDNCTEDIFVQFIPSIWYGIMGRPNTPTEDNGASFLMVLTQFRI